MEFAEQFQRAIAKIPGTEIRPTQTAMADMVFDCLRDRRHGLIEAGTGSGKSLAYLIAALESGRKVVVATHTKALQNQILLGDIPKAEQALGRKINVQLARGRSNYTCLRKLYETKERLENSSEWKEGELMVFKPLVNEVIRRWEAGEWPSGDRNLLDIQFEDRYWSLLNSDSEDCLGRECPNFSFTPFREARKQLQEADLIVANHAVYFSDLVHGAGILPPHDAVIFDEAHHLPQVISETRELVFTSGALTKLLNRINRRLGYALGSDFQDAEQALWFTLAALRTQIFALQTTSRDGSFILDDYPMILRLIGELAIHLENLIQMLKRAIGGVTLKKFRLTEVEDAESALEKWASLASPSPGWVLHAEMSVSKRWFVIKKTPLDNREWLKTNLWEKRTGILTSATIALGSAQNAFDWFQSEMGVPKPRQNIFRSPFNYPRQMGIFYPDPEGLPERDESSREWAAKIAPLIEDLVRRSQGNAFLLFTSREVMQRVSDEIKDRLPFLCLVQGDYPTDETLKKFKETPHAVLFGVATYWEGVDVPGDALQLVIIDRIPFANQGDAYWRAKRAWIEENGGKFFWEYDLPRAALQLKQGFGRLIRTKTDRGIVVLLDKRVKTKSYGRLIRNALPNGREITLKEFC